MLIKEIILAALFFSAGKQGAFVDLSQPPRTPDTGSHEVNVSGGGILYHGNRPHPLPGTPTVSVKLRQIIERQDGPLLKDIVEVVLTNTGKTAISIPVGDDPVPLLAQTEPERRYFEFAVKLLKTGRIIEVVVSASNAARPESSAVLQPGDTALFWLPAGTWSASDSTNLQRDGAPDITVTLSLNRKVIDGGKDWNQIVGESIAAENSLPLAHPAGPVVIH